MIPAKKQTLRRYRLLPRSCHAVGDLPKDEKVTPAPFVSATYEGTP